MRDLSTPELRELGNQFGISIADSEADDLREGVNEMLAPLSDIDNLAIGTKPETGTDRSWRTPTNNPHNALVTRCNIAPSGDGPLSGISVGVKDIIAVAGIPMECASAVMQGYIPQQDAAIVDRLRLAGGRITAKTNLDEFAASGSGHTAVSGPITNPHDANRTAGGSSGGSAVAVAIDEVDVALGTDTGGSIRIPAGFCGVIGLKPTYGLIPLHGIVENTYTQDHVGPISQSLDLVGKTLDALAGPDHRDPASLQAAGRPEYQLADYAAACEDPPSPSDLSLGVLTEGFGSGVSEAVETATEAVIDALQDSGASITRVSIPEFTFGKAIKNILSFTELAAHWRDRGAPIRRGGVVDEDYQSALASRATTKSGDLGAFYKQKLLAGAQIIAAHDGRPYTRAQAAREELIAAANDIFESVDSLVLPTLPAVAPRVEAARDPGFDYARNTRFADITRLPAITLPNGASDGLPIGFQLMGQAFTEADLLGQAATIEEFLASPTG